MVIQATVVIAVILDGVDGPVYLVILENLVILGGLEYLVTLGIVEYLDGAGCLDGLVFLDTLVGLE